ATTDIRMYVHLLPDAPDGWADRFVTAAQQVVNSWAGEPAGLSWPMRQIVRSIRLGDVPGVVGAVDMLSTAGGRQMRPAVTAALAHVASGRLRRR
ncbi:MAG: hypothetical protein AAGG08_19590, partial [Actinomycetota bacterium]